MSSELRVIFVYSLIGFLNDLFLFNWAGATQLLLNIDLYAFTIIEFVLFALFLLQVIHNKMAKNILKTTILLYLVFAILLAFLNHFKSFDSLTISIEILVIIGFSVYYLFEQLKNPQTLFIYSSPVFWCIIAILIYLAGTFFLFTLAESLPEKEREGYWFINYIFNTLKYILFTVAMLVKQNKTVIPTFIDKSGLGDEAPEWIKS